MQSDFYLKKVLKYTCMLFTFVLLWSIKSYNASASSAEVSIQSSEKQVVKGDIVYVIITVNSSDTMSGFEGYFTYDSRVLQYITGGSVANGNDDKFQISDTGRESGVNTLKYSVKFVARKTGSTSIELKQPCAVYSSEDSSKMSVSSDTLNIMVKKTAKAAKKPDVKSTAKPQPPKDGDKKDMRQPPETPDVESLQATVAKAAAATAKPKKKTKKNNNKNKTDDISDKKTDKSVTATYQNSVTTIHCYDEYVVTEVKDEKIIPAGFGKTEIVLSGHVITAYATENDIDHTYVLIYCKKGRQEPQFYLYDTENDSFMQYDKVKSWYKGSMGNTVVGSDSIYETKIKTMKYVVAIMVIICLLMLIGMLTIYLHYRENNNIIDMYDDFGNSGKVPEKVGQTEIEKEVAEHEFSYKETVESEDVKENENPVQENLFEEEESNVTHYWKRD